MVSNEGEAWLTCWRTKEPRGTWLPASSPAALSDAGGQWAAEQPLPDRAGAGGPAPDASITSESAAALSAAPAHCSSEGDKHRETQSSAASEINRCAGRHRSGDNASAPPQAPDRPCTCPRRPERASWEAGCVPSSLKKWSPAPRMGAEVEKKEAPFVTNSLEYGFCQRLTRNSNAAPGCSPL